MNNRIPIFVLGGLVLLAVIARIISPPAPVPPGPLGAMPHWSSHVRFGDLGPYAVNPEGTMWAGAWNANTKSGKLKSAVWIIDFNNSKAKTCILKDGVYAYGLTWADDGKTIKVAAAPSDKPLADKKWQAISINAESGDIIPKESFSINDKVIRIVNWPSDKSSNMLAQTSGSKMTLAITSSENGEIIGKEVATGLRKNAGHFGMSAINPDNSSFVFSVSNDDDSNVNYYLADTAAGTSKKIFTLQDLPGKVENLWVSKAGVLVLCAANKNLEMYVDNLATGKLQKASEAGLDIASTWPNAPKNMILAEFSGCYDYDIAKCKSKKIMDLSKFDRREEDWHMSIRGGQLYPRKDGNFTSVSVIDEFPDIRIITKDGTKDSDLLPR